MKKLIILIAAIALLATPVHALDIKAPEVPSSGQVFLPDNTENFTQGLWEIIKEAVRYLKPSIASAAGTCLGVIATVMLVSLTKLIPGASEHTVMLVGTLGTAAALLSPSAALIRCGAETVLELSRYGRLLIPVLTTALAAQGGISSSTALYTGTIAFDAVLSSLASSLVIPMIYIFLVLAVASCTVGEPLLGKLKEFVKWLMTWSLKIILYIFTGFIGITGVVSGSVDAAALKATKLTISGVVPVVGGILSDASEAVLVSAGVVKNAAGVYGLLAIIALWVGPFIEIGVQYLLLKGTGALCDGFGIKQVSGLIKDFSTAMGLLLAMTGTVCLLLMISVVCFMRGMA